MIRRPYRGTTRVGREIVTPGIPGTLGVPVPDPTGSVAARAGAPPSDIVVRTTPGPFDGATQPVGTDIEPMVLARARVAVTLPRPAQFRATSGYGVA
ncbi:MAG: hypothetical protein QOD58_4507 [Mycobacterium sp.]|jgi:hypothetical protein|nr:hypothetical protein [Mycobacterium sp.]